MEMETFRWILIIGGVLIVLGIYGYSREIKKDQQDNYRPGNDDYPIDDIPHIDPLMDELPDDNDDADEAELNLLKVHSGEIVDSIVIHVFAQEDELIEGEDLFAAFDEMKLQRTTDHFFAYVEEGKLFYQVCSAFKPGSFPHDNPLAYQTKGITFFMTLPKADGKACFEKMLLDIHQLSLKLDGRILDEDRNGLSQQMLNHLRDRIIKVSLASKSH